MAGGAIYRYDVDLGLCQICILRRNFEHFAKRSSGLLHCRPDVVLTGFGKQEVGCLREAHTWSCAGPGTWSFSGHILSGGKDECLHLFRSPQYMLMGLFGSGR